MRRIWWGILLILIGFWIWAPGLHLPPIFQFSHSWPVLLVLLGVRVIYRGIRHSGRRRNRKTDALSDLEQGRIGVDEAVSRIKGNRE